jgi:hypothetical protein
MTIAGPKFERVILGRRTRYGTDSGPRWCAARAWRIIIRVSSRKTL